MLRSEEERPCSDHCQLHCYFPFIGGSLEREVARRGAMDERRAWFLLNEVSKGLELLGENEQAHWGIAPDTILVNSYGNYYIHNSLFVLGPRPLCKPLPNLESTSTANALPSPSRITSRPSSIAGQPQATLKLSKTTSTALDWL